nr:unnamed protein product [Digitaria exilis]
MMHSCSLQCRHAAAAGASIRMVPGCLPRSLTQGANAGNRSKPPTRAAVLASS